MSAIFTACHSCRIFQPSIRLVTYWRLCVFAAILIFAELGYAQPITQIAGSGVTSFFLKSDGSLWGMGRNTSGQLGNGSTNNAVYPELVVSSNVTSIAAGRFHSLFVKSDGSLWGMGLNSFGQLGGLATGAVLTPKLIVSNSVTAVAAGYHTSLFLKSNGSLWGLGLGTDGALGNAVGVVTTPVQIVASNVTAIAASGGPRDYSLFLKADGSLWGMGYNGTGQLGNGTTNSVYTPIQIVASNVLAVAAGSDTDSQTLFLKTDGSLWGMGYNANGELGNGTTNHAFFPEQLVSSNVMAVSAGFRNSLFLKTDGSLWGMGKNDFAQLGIGSNIPTNRPIQIFSGAVTQVVGGVIHTQFLKADGSLWGMGDNQYGELGLGTNSNASLPTRILGAYNQLAFQGSENGAFQLYFVGSPGLSYILEGTPSLQSNTWNPTATNVANSFGALSLTNQLAFTNALFWRMHLSP